MGKFGRYFFSILLLLMAVGLIAVTFSDSPTISSVLFAILIAFSVIVVLLFWLMTLLNAMRHPRLGNTERVIWILTILLLNIPGAFLYILFARPDLPGQGEVTSEAPRTEG